MDQIKISKYSHYQKYSPKDQYPTNIIPAKNRTPSLEGGHSTKNSSMWTPENEIISTKFYELLIKKELKFDTALELKKFYNHTSMCLNAANRLREGLITDYQSRKRHYEFEEYFVPDSDHSSYYYNVQVHTYLLHSLLVEITNDTCVKSSMIPQA